MMALCYESVEEGGSWRLMNDAKLSRLESSWATVFSATQSSKFSSCSRDSIRVVLTEHMLSAGLWSRGRSPVALDLGELKGGPGARFGALLIGSAL